jgi:hypothetical protein
MVQVLFAGDILKGILPNSESLLVLRLKNGDIVSGYVIEMINSPDDGEGVKLKTVLGTATIFAKEIIEIHEEHEYYRHKHRVFLLPTAEPIENDHFIGNFEMLFLYGGFGILDWVSVTAGRSLIPGIRSSEQISVVNAKVTLLEEEFPDVARSLSLAIGTNYTFINSNNRLVHYYGVATAALSRTSLTAAIFYKGGSKDIYRIRMANNALDLTYGDGAFGLGLGLDTKLSRMHDLHFIGELWNSDATKPTNTGVLLGLRLCNSSFSADFGLSFFTQPFIAPFCSFVWTPF